MNKELIRKSIEHITLQPEEYMFTVKSLRGYFKEALASLDESEETVEYCEWTLDRDEYFSPSCRTTISIMKTVHMGTFCRYCGKPINIKE